MNISELLRGCEGEKFYTLDLGEMTLLEVDKYDDIIFIKEEEYYGRGRRCIYVFNSDGRKHEEGECLVFPSKTQRDWTKFNKDEFCTKFRLEKFQTGDEVLVRNCDKEIWKKRIFSDVTDYNGVRAALAGRSIRNEYYFLQCIPYNDDNKHLLKTKKMPNEYYIWW